MGLKPTLAWLFILLAGPMDYAYAQPVQESWGLAQLMHEMAQVRSASGRFEERKTIQLLNAPLMASGTLTYVAPDYLRKLTLSPVMEDFVLDHNKATISGGPDQQVHSFSMADNPQIGGLVEGVRATLAGDLPTLEAFYMIQLSGDESNWRLYLLPRDQALAHFVKWIVVLGSRDHITAIDTASGNGDHSEMGINEETQDAR